MEHAWVNYWKRYVDFTSVSSRSDFWFMVLINGIIKTLLAFVFFGSIMSTAVAGRVISGQIWGWIALYLLVIYSLATIVPDLALHFRRFKDAGVPGWIYLVCIALSLFYGSGIIVITVIECLPSSGKYGHIDGTPVHPNAPRTIKNDQHKDDNDDFFK